MALVCLGAFPEATASVQVACMFSRLRDPCPRIRGNVLFSACRWHLLTVSSEGLSWLGGDRELFPGFLSGPVGTERPHCWTMEELFS